MAHPVNMDNSPIKDSRYSIYDILTPVLNSMKIFGIYYDTENTKFSKNPTSPKLAKFYKIYCVAVIVLLWVTVFRYIPCFWVGFDYQPNQTVNKVIRQCWFWQCAVTISVLLWHCRIGTWNYFYCEWNQVITDAICSKYIDKKTDQMRRVMKKALAVAILYFVFIVVSILLSIFLFNGSSIISCPFPGTIEMGVLFLVLELFDDAAWIFPYVFVITICYCLAQAFSMVTECLQDSINHCNKCPDNFNNIRQIHLKLCQMVDHLDKPFRIWIISIFGCSVFLVCFILYDLVTIDHKDFVDIILKCSWLANSILSVFVLCWFIASVNESAHSPLQHIYKIQTDGLSTQQLGQLTLCLSKLTGPPIGFTAMGFFTVTKEVILTIFGLYLTYFFLLLQFKIS